ncbi:MAG: helix-turn-helix domain-containing protein [Traorella sp.]
MIGDKIRQLRQSKGLTLKQLSERTQTTAGYISQLERNLVDPSLSTLRKIAAVLEIPMFSLLDDNDSLLVESHKRQKMTFPDSSVIHELLTPAHTTSFLMLTTRLAPQTWSNEEPISHNCQEWIFVMKGTIEVYTPQNNYILNTGDSIYIKENTPHNIYNPHQNESICISSMTPAVFISSVHPYI